MENKNNNNNNVDSTVNGGDLEAKQTNNVQIDGVHSSSTALHHPSPLMRQYYGMINRLVKYLNGAADELEALRRENHSLRAVNKDFKNESVTEGAVNVEKVLLPKDISVGPDGYLIQDGSSSSPDAGLVQKYEDLKDLINLCLKSLRAAEEERDKLLEHFQNNMNN